MAIISRSLCSSSLGFVLKGLDNFFVIRNNQPKKRLQITRAGALGVWLMPAVNHYEKKVILSSHLEVRLHGGFHNILSRFHLTPPGRWCGMGAL